MLTTSDSTFNVIIIEMIVKSVSLEFEILSFKNTIIVYNLMPGGLNLN